MGFTLGLNTNFAINRIVEPEALVGTIAQEIGMSRIQLTPEFLDPAWPPSLQARFVDRYVKALAANGAQISTTFSGAFTRVNHLGHPDPDVRAWWKNWLGTWIDLSADLGAKGTGTLLAIMTYADDADDARREAVLKRVIDDWRDLAERAKENGLEFLMWEHMSIRREFGHTLAETRRIQALVEQDMPLPFKICADIDHGDVTSKDPRDYDPYAIAEALAADSPVIHIKQSSMDKGGHRPFTPENNANGRITPEPLLAAIRKGGGTDNELVFEFSFREREPTDGTVIEALKQSADYWRPFVEV